MREFPTFLIKRLASTLASKYGVSVHKQLCHTHTRYAPRDAWFYLNNFHALQVMKLLGQTDYRHRAELLDFVNLFRADGALSNELPPLLSMVMAELRNTETLFDFLNAVVLRFSIFPSERVWLEGRNSCVRCYHDHHHKELAGCGPQSHFAILINEARGIFDLSEDNVAVNFSKAGIRDDEGFFRLTGIRPQYRGESSYIEFKGEINTITNKSFNKQIVPQIEHMIDLLIEQSCYVPETDSIVPRIVALIDATINDVGRIPDLEEISSTLAMSRASVYRRLLAEGTSYSKIQNSFRLEKSKRLLLVSRESVSQISDQLGFSCLSSFSRFFKLHAGVSPLEFRATPPRTERC